MYYTVQNGNVYLSGFLGLYTCMVPRPLVGPRPRHHPHKESSVYESGSCTLLYAAIAIITVAHVVSGKMRSRWNSTRFYCCLQDFIDKTINQAHDSNYCVGGGNYSATVGRLASNLASCWDRQTERERERERGSRVVWCLIHDEIQSAARNTRRY